MGWTGEREMLLQARDWGAQREKGRCVELELARKTVLDLEQHVQRLESQLEDEMHRKQREQTQLAREEEEWQENRKREQEAKAQDAQAIRALMSQVQKYEKTVAHLAHTESSSMLSPKSILGLVKPADATQNKAKDLEAKLAVRRQWENEDPRQHGGIILDSVGTTPSADSFERPRTTVGVMLVDNMIDHLVVGGPAYNSRALREGDYIVGVDALQVDAQDLPAAIIGQDEAGSVVTLRVRYLLSK
jgi:hypothetical protein